MNLVKIKDIFETYYGNKLDLNKMTIVDKSSQEGISFVARTAKNLGVAAKVKKIPKVEPYPEGLITVALGGAILSSFVQPRKFYTSQNIMVLKPKEEMSFQEKMFYCVCIEKNKFRYGAFGREANRTLKDLLVPNEIPDWANKTDLAEIDKRDSENKTQKNIINTENWKEFFYKDIFTIIKGKRVVNGDLKKGLTPLIRPIDSNNGVTARVDLEPNHNGNLMTVNYNGNGVAETYYQPEPFFAVDDVHILYPKFTLTPEIAMFLATLIQKEKYRFNYGRKWHLGRMNESVIKLPVTETGEPDWNFMELYIKSLPYSSELVD